MEADWEFEIGGEAPVIDALWSGFLDLRANPSLALAMAETAALPALAAALMTLNSPGSPVWTSKCDFWPAMQPSDFDEDELDAPPGEATHAMGCYIDLLPRNTDAWSSPKHAEAVCRSFCAALHLARLRSCRIDLIIRSAFLGDSQDRLGITAYFTACGSTPLAAKAVLAEAVTAFASAISSK